MQDISTVLDFNKSDIRRNHWVVNLERDLTFMASVELNYVGEKAVVTKYTPGDVVDIDWVEAHLYFAEEHIEEYIQDNNIDISGW